VKYRFPNYEAFENWVCLHLRAVARDKPEWKFAEKQEPIEENEQIQKWLDEWAV